MRSVINKNEREIQEPVSSNTKQFTLRVLAPPSLLSGHGEA